jgi:anti-anti-sigma regulatory factor
MSDCTMTREAAEGRAIYRLGGVFDRGAAWELREAVEREAAGEVLLDFSLVRDFSDLGVAVLAHGLTSATRRVVFRGLRQHQLRIFRYCGIAVEETSARDAAVPASTPSPRPAGTGSRPSP